MNTDAIRRRFGFLLHDVARLYGKRFDQRVRRLGLTRAQCRVLAYLLLNEGINQSGLAELLEIEPISLVRLLDRMEEAGLVERRPDPTDRRVHCLFLTAKAQPVLEEVRALADAHETEVCADLSAAEKRSVIELLLKVHAKLTDAPLDSKEHRIEPKRSKR